MCVWLCCLACGGRDQPSTLSLQPSSLNLTLPTTLPHPPYCTSPHLQLLTSTQEAELELLKQGLNGINATNTGTNNEFTGTNGFNATSNGFNGFNGSIIPTDSAAAGGTMPWSQGQGQGQGQAQELGQGQALGQQSPSHSQPSWAGDGQPNYAGVASNANTNVSTNAYAYGSNMDTHNTNSNYNSNYNFNTNANYDANANYTAFNASSEVRVLASCFYYLFYFFVHGSSTGGGGTKVAPGLHLQVAPRCWDTHMQSGHRRAT